MNVSHWLMALDQWGFATIRLLLAALWQSSILFVAIAVLAWILRKRRTSVRHSLWVAALFVAPLLPLLASVASRAGAPQAEVALLPTYFAPAVEVASPLERPHPPEALEYLAPSAAIAPVESTPEEARQVSLLEYRWALLMMAYAAGVIVLLTWVVIGRTCIRQWVRKGTPATAERVLSAFKRARKKLGLRPEVLVVESPGVPTPFTTGILRPVVLLPSGLTQHLTDEELEAVSLHETAHVRRHDTLILALISLVRAVLFFHPLVWWACREIALLAEEAADDAVLEATGEEVSYAKMLTRLAEDLPRRTLSTEVAVGIVLSRNAFLRRVEAILSHRRHQLRRLSRLTLIATVLGAVISLALAAALPLGERIPPSGEATPSSVQTRIDTESQLPTAVPVPLAKADFSEELANRIVAAVSKQQLPFLAQDKLDSLRLEMQALVATHTPEDLAPERRESLLRAVDRYVPEYFPRAQAGRVYLDFRDLIGTLKWRLWLALGRKELDSTQAEKLEQQREWMRTWVRSRPDPSKAVEQVMAQLERLFNDPLCPLFQTPMTDLEFSEFAAAVKSSGDQTPIHALAEFVSQALRVRFPPKPGLLGKFELPFEDCDVGFSTTNEKLNLKFASNDEFLGTTRRIRDIDDGRPGSILDIATCRTLDVPAWVTGDGELREWLNQEGKGDIAYDYVKGGGLLAVRGARISLLSVPDWIAADAITNEELQQRLSAHGERVIQLKKFTDAYHSRQSFSAFVAIQTREGWLAVLQLKRFDNKWVSGLLRGRGQAWTVIDEPTEVTWGKSSDGVQCRLRADKLVWEAGEVPILKADVRNRGKRELWVLRAQAGCELEFDGKWFEQKEIAAQISPFPPGQRYDDIPITLDDPWVTPRDDERLRLEPGKHKVRVAFISQPAGSDKGGPVRVVSNPVEIEILPSSSAEGPFAPGKRIPLKVVAGTPEHPKVIETEWIKFEREDDQIQGELHLKWLSVEAAKWQVTLRLLTAEGDILKTAQAILAITARALEVKPGAHFEPWYIATLEFSLGRWENVSKATRFRVIIEPAAQPVVDAAFGPVIKRKLFDAVGKEEFIDFETGVVFPLPEVVPLRGRQFEAWLRINGIDASVDMGDGRPTSGWLKGHDLPYKEVSAGLWDSLTPEQIRQFLARPNAGLRARVDSETKQESIYVFRTRIGNIGVLELLEVHNPPPAWIRLRYKMVQPEPQAVSERPVSDSARVEVSGRVTDEQTGKPIERYALQWGSPSVAVFSASGGAHTHSRQLWPEGRFSTGFRWPKAEKIWFRVRAPGYVSQPVTPEPLTPPATVHDLEVVLNRGRQIQGRIMDHRGRPAAGARVFLGDYRRGVSLNDGDDTRHRGPRAITDKGGRFVLAGATEGPAPIVVSAPSLHVWRVEAPELDQEITIMLPEPATLVVRYDIEGDNDPGCFFLRLSMREMKGWKGVTSKQSLTVSNKGEAALKNVTPGVYLLDRIKRVDTWGGIGCDRTAVTLEAGKTTEVEFVRKTGHPITGEVTGLSEAEFDGAVIFVKGPQATGDVTGDGST